MTCTHWMPVDDYWAPILTQQSGTGAWTEMRSVPHSTLWRSWIFDKFGRMSQSCIVAECARTHNRRCGKHDRRFPCKMLKYPAYGVLEYTPYRFGRQALYKLDLGQLNLRLYAGQLCQQPPACLFAPKPRPLALRDLRRVSPSNSLPRPQLLARLYLVLRLST